MGIEDLPSKTRSKVLWHLNKVPLIVKAENCHEEQVKHVIRLLEKVEKKKVVLLGNATKEGFQGWKIFQDLSDLPNEGVYTDIIKHFAVSLQGRPPIFLDQLLNFDQGNDRTVETRELIKMTQVVLQIGRKQEEAFEKKNSYCSESRYYRVFGVADYEFEIRFIKFKMKSYLLISSEQF
jgi:hypothetical protein